MIMVQHRPAGSRRPSENAFYRNRPKVVIFSESLENRYLTPCLQFKGYCDSTLMTRAVIFDLKLSLVLSFTCTVHVHLFFIHTVFFYVTDTTPTNKTHSIFISWHPLHYHRMKAYFAPQHYLLS